MIGGGDETFGSSFIMWSLLALTRLMNMFNGTRGSRSFYNYNNREVCEEC
ncbi:Hypothetical protein FKW44_007301 [Caligus rogercresseyi]|uniref:Uncharacterized protein n=1 Tax=Caligus rogercresseyi TaxID=217165 RepID=A0A7T8KEI9_CALRO|nr:Hypothetical protein FKW44_007301 [Caligus rogercresseyi]